MPLARPARHLRICPPLLLSTSCPRILGSWGAGSVPPVLRLENLGDLGVVARGPAPTPPFPCSLAVKCSMCKSVSDTYDPYLDVALEIRVHTSC